MESLGLPSLLLNQYAKKAAANRYTTSDLDLYKVPAQLSN